MYIHFEFSDHSNPYVFYGSPLECLKQTENFEKKYYVTKVEKSDDGVFFKLSRCTNKHTLKGKDKIRLEAMNWQYTFCINPSYSELVEAQAYFEKQGKRYGLLREFRENGII